MEFWTLDETFQPFEVVGNYQSLIWTERYEKAGDFQAVSSDIKYLIDILPLETYVTLRETTVPMKVEVHKIEKKKNQAPVLTITGRSVEACWLELRASVLTPAQFPPSGTGFPTTGSSRPEAKIKAWREADAAWELMRQVLGDVDRYKNGTLVGNAKNPAVDVKDAIPELDMVVPADYRQVPWSSTYTYPGAGYVVYEGGVYYTSTALSNNVGKEPSANPTYWTVTAEALALSATPIPDVVIPAGNLYATVMSLLAPNRRGLKAIRPGPNSAKISIEIYNGANLTSTVSFDARLGAMDEATYLLSHLGETNVAYVYGPNGSDKVLKTSAPEPSGLARRVLLVDSNSDTTINTSAARQSLGLVELYKNNATALFGGSVADIFSSGYNETYFLGDILTLVGEYGLSQSVRVAEFIRSDEITGERAYPTFEAVT